MSARVTLMGCSDLSNASFAETCEAPQGVSLRAAIARKNRLFALTCERGGRGRKGARLVRGFRPEVSSESTHARRAGISTKVADVLGKVDRLP